MIRRQLMFRIILLLWTIVLMVNSTSAIESDQQIDGQGYHVISNRPDLEKLELDAALLPDGTIDLIERISLENIDVPLTDEAFQIVVQLPLPQNATLDPEIQVKNLNLPNETYTQVPKFVMPCHGKFILDQPQNNISVCISPQKYLNFEVRLKILNPDVSLTDSIEIKNSFSFDAPPAQSYQFFGILRGSEGVKMRPDLPHSCVSNGINMKRYLYNNGAICKGIVELPMTKQAQFVFSLQGNNTLRQKEIQQEEYERLQRTELQAATDVARYTQINIVISIVLSIISIVILWNYTKATHRMVEITEKSQEPYLYLKPSVLNYGRLVLELCNSGEHPARNVVMTYRFNPKGTEYTLHLDVLSKHDPRVYTPRELPSLGGTGKTEFETITGEIKWEERDGTERHNSISIDLSSTLKWLGENQPNPQKMLSVLGDIKIVLDRICDRLSGRR